MAKIFVDYKCRIFYWQRKLVLKMIASKQNNNKNTHSGSKYPGVPATTADTWLPPSAGKILDSPKSASLAWKFSFNKMFVDFTSL